MFQAIYNSLSGLFAFSQALDTVSNNVANMNTPGFRGSDSFFADVAGGYGTQIKGEGLRSAPGKTEQTGNATDLAINGAGFFILRDSAGNLFYTRAGQFVFNADGILTDSVTGYEVMSIGSGGALERIDETSFRTLPSETTTRVNITGNVDLGFGQSSVTIPPVKIVGADGIEHTWTITLTNDDPPGAVFSDSFTVTVKDETGATIANSGLPSIITYDPTQGGPVAGKPAQFDFIDTYGGKNQTVTLNFGVPGSSDGSTGFPGIGMRAVAAAADGHLSLSLTNSSFDSNGVLQLTYSSSAKRTGPQIALASFSSENALQLIGGRLISGAQEPAPLIGRPGQGLFGSIAGASLELADVDLTQEFATMIIIQRGYQASSRVMTVSNQMLEDLYNNAQGGGG